MKRWYWMLIVLALVAGTFEAGATHLRAGQITVKRVGCTNLFEITLNVFLDMDGVEFGGSYEFNLGDGTTHTLIRDRIQETVIDATLKVSKITYKLTHTYGPGRFVVSYREQNRNANVLNMDNSVTTTFYIETTITIDPALESILGCNSTPVLLIDPIDRGCTGVAFSHNPGAVDPDGDSLSYELVVPFQSKGTQVLNYRDPNNPQFYASLNYNQANEAGNGPPTFTINEKSGTIKWDAPGAPGEYNIAFIVKEWRKRNGRVYQLGFVRRDMQIIVADCDNERPRLEVPKDTCIVAGTTLTALIKGFDDLGVPAENHDVKIEAFSDVFGLTVNPATYTPFPPNFQPSSPFASLNFTWETSCEHVKDQPYQVVFKITDRPPTGPRLVTFETWRITVVAPPPLWVSATSDVAARTAALQWEPYTCDPVFEGIKIQIWRKVDGAPFTPDNCETGMPEFLGFDLIAEKDGDVTTYLDKGLAPGARYCYRLVAIFPLPTGGESIVSDEICVDPILVDAPVITHVTVDRTGRTDGEVTIKWLAPFEIDAGQFPPPYEYVVQRSENPTDFQSGLVHSGRLDETTLEATDVALDTENDRYYYRVLLYAPNVSADAVDTSAIASTVRLELTPYKDSIQLDWNAFVPWSNQIQTFPNHDTYRGPDGAVLNSELTFLIPVNVFDKGQTYMDKGPLNTADIYCYQVMTRGGYGNPNITEPLENYSQIMCTSLRDDVPPCNETKLVVDLTDCSDFDVNACNFSQFENTLTWNMVREDCGADIKRYRIYVSSSKNGEYVLLAEKEVGDTTYTDRNLSSFARCYRIATVDRSGNESEWSAPVCNENCPNFVLPNIFTPNGDSYNDTFKAFSFDDIVSGPPCGENCSPEEVEEWNKYVTYIQSNCIRFVTRVKIRIYNRWGREVYNYESGGDGIVINWNGRDKDGTELATGIYYYSADVTFVAADPSKAVKTYKGWVHLMR
jgi:hypothetical protein